MTSASTFELREPGGLAHAALKVLAVASTGMRRRYVQLGEMAVRSLFLVLPLFTFSQLWRAVTHTVAPRPAGLALEQLVWYLAFAEAIVFTPSGNLELELDREVRNGDIAYRVARPLSYPLYHLAASCGDRALRFAFNFALGAGLAWLLVGPIGFRPGVMALALLAAAFSVLIDELNLLGISLTAFWLESTAGMHLMYRRAMLLLGGALIPIDAYPAWLAALCRHLPFAQLVAAPARLFVSPDAGAALGVLGTQALFAAGSASLVSIIYGIGVRRLVAQGG